MLAHLHLVDLSWWAPTRLALARATRLDVCLPRELHDDSRSACRAAAFGQTGAAPPRLSQGPRDALGATVSSSGLPFLRCSLALGHGLSCRRRSPQRSHRGHIARRQRRVRGRARSLPLPSGTCSRAWASSARKRGSRWGTGPARRGHRHGGSRGRAAPRTRIAVAAAERPRHRMRRVDRPAAADETWPAGHLRPLRLRRRAHPGASKWASHAQEAHAP